MITNLFIPPHPALQPFVEPYVLSTSHNQTETFASQWPASHETSLIFYLADKPTHASRAPATSLAGREHCVVGLLTNANGEVHFQGHYHTFIIQFKANGFFKLVGLPMAQLRDQILSTTDVFGPPAGLLYDRLGQAGGIHQMARFADAFLLPFVSRNANNLRTADGITVLASQLAFNTQPQRVAHYANQANMSVRNFDRRFAQQVGIPPKLYARLLRFNKALEMKLQAPAKSWSAIGYEWGYFDQMHFIKDFKQFTGLTPTHFFVNSPPCRSASNHPLDKSPGQGIAYTLPSVDYVYLGRADE